MNKEVFLGILRIHDKTIVVYGAEQEAVEMEVEEEINKANKKFPNIDFHDKVEVYQARKIK